MNDEEKEDKTDCTKCTGWYNSCAPDDYPDYINNPEYCPEFEDRDIRNLLGVK